MILELDENADSGKIETVIRRSLGPDQSIKKKSPRALLDIKNIDPTISEEELIEIAANKLEVKINEVNVKSLKTMFSGNLKAIIQIPVKTANEIEENPRVRIGYTICTFKLTNNIIRSFRCHGLGHLSYNSDTMK